MQSFRIFWLSASLFSVITPWSALATMPELTATPAERTPSSCQSWAAKQDNDAVEMWGYMKDGGTSRDVALMRLTLSCLGDEQSDIVGFNSSAGTNEDFCHRHADWGICKGQTQGNKAEVSADASASDHKITLVCRTQMSGIHGIAITVDTDALSVREELDHGNGCAEVVDVANNVRRPLAKLVGCGGQVLSNDEDDQMVEMTDDQITFGVKSNPQRIDRSNGVLRGANGLIIAVCEPAGTGKKF